ncbi:MAG: transcription initiation factor IIB family protein [Promethearchaeota archaeon]|nr:MAG: transcription initiation factor IIB family protein [Candidatus Lokiarchaeota archaeon]
MTHKSKEKDHDYEDEPCCDNPDIRTINGETVCVNCGMVFERNIVAQQKRAYTAAEVEERRRTEPTWRKYGARTTIPSAKKGDNMSPDQKVLFRRLAKIQNSLVSSIERNFWEARPQLKMATSSLNIPSYIEETAWKIYTEAVKKKMTVGRTIKGFIAAALYAAIRVHEHPIILNEICEVLEISEHKVVNALGLLINDILPKLGLKYHSITPQKLIFRFGSDLDIPVKQQKKANDLLTNAFERGLRKTGKDPRGFAVAALYLATLRTPFQKTQSEFAEVAGITEVTLRSRIKDIKRYLKF